MAIIFDISSFLDDQPEPEPTNVHQFPAKVAVACDVRHARRMVEELEHAIAVSDPRSADVKERVTAACSPPMLEYWQGELARAEAELAVLNVDAALVYRGKRYIEMAGRA